LALRALPQRKLAIERGWLWLHESGTYVKLTQDRRQSFRQMRMLNERLVGSDGSVDA
jgi:hypothetical protein